MSSASTAAPSPVRLWTTETLQPLRSVGDPLADGVIDELIQDGGVLQINALLSSFVANEHPTPADLPPPIREYFQLIELPAWADPNMIKKGEDVFWRFGPRLMLVLTCYSLPFCYLGRDGVPVLALTNRLSSNPKRRIVETAQMLVDCLSTGGLTTPGGRGLLTIQKVRLMHAMIRRLVTSTFPSWESEHGLPVNQEDLAGTLMSFSHVGLDGLDKFGVELTDEDRQAYVHSWNVIGNLLGIRDEMLPATPPEANTLAAAIAAHQFGPTKEGEDLTKALMDMLGHILPGDLFDRVPAMLAHFFLGKEWAGWLGISEGILADLAEKPLRFAGMAIGDIIEDSDVVGDMAEEVGKLLIGALLLVERGGNRPSFAIPTELRQVWGVNWNS